MNVDFVPAAADLVASLIETAADANSAIVSEAFRQEAIANLAVFVMEFNARMLADIHANLSKLN